MKVSACENDLVGPSAGDMAKDCDTESMFLSCKRSLHFITENHRLQLTESCGQSNFLKKSYVYFCGKTFSQN